MRALGRSASGLLAVATLLACSARDPGRPAGVPAAEGPPTAARGAWLRQHAVALRSVDPADEDFSDLEPLARAFGDARVVVLGEGSHGEGTTFLAKARLVRFLHQRLGYDVLAVESGFYDCWKAWQQIRAGEDPATGFRHAVFTVWTKSRQVQPLIDYFAAAARSPRPLELAGFDSQFTGTLGGHLEEDLGRVADAAGLSGTQLRARIAAPLRNLTEGAYELGELPDAAVRTDFLAAVDELATRLRQRAEEVPERGFWIRFLDGLRDSAASSWATDWTKPLLEDVVNYPVRDRVMGEHLAWLARERYPHRKIVAWMHSGHAARNLRTVDTGRPDLWRLYRVHQPAGAVAFDRLGRQVYTVGVLSYQGQTKFANLNTTPKARPVPPPDSLEAAFHASGLPHAFLDLRPTLARPRWLLGRLPASPMGDTLMRASWRQVFDGVLFIDTMEPSERVPKPAAPSPGG